MVTEAERQLEYHDSAVEDLVAKLQRIPTKMIADATGYNPRTVSRLKHGEFWPSANRLSQILTLASRRGIIPRYDGIPPISVN